MFMMTKSVTVFTNIFFWYFQNLHMTNVAFSLWVISSLPCVYYLFVQAFGFSAFVSICARYIPVVNNNNNNNNDNYNNNNNNNNKSWILKHR